MKYEEMRGIMNRLNSAVGGHWFISADGRPQPEYFDDFDGIPLLGDGRKRKPKPRSVIIGTDLNTEHIAVLNTEYMDPIANGRFIAHAREDIFLLIAEIARLAAALQALGHEAAMTDKGMAKFERAIGPGAGAVTFYPADLKELKKGGDAK